ncbi:alpha/beta hydrolase [Microbacterium sp. NEAU-LLC]|uniref:Alpha/beta hydrolase n=1 Tax=Microbacterium helvum TaxID=2773713 RepID=A0ABR8NUM9_9MICO|nr:alpha/beta hydrolase [Microbacterium helvum]MBD3942761.1 alpha/beta hydrolase [Microbacterium helvum]
MDVIERTISIPGLEIHTVETGEGAPMLLLHGFPQSSRVYARAMAAMAAMGGGARLIAVDMRGAGATQVTPGGYDVKSIERDLLGLLDALALERVMIVAHDWSAFAAFELCLDHPERVSRLVAIAAPAPYLELNRELAGALVKAMKDLWFQVVVATPVLGPRLLSRGKQRLTRWILRHFEVQPMRDDDVEAYLALLRDPARARAAGALYRQLILPGFWNLIAGKYRGRVLRVPTLVLYGAADDLIPHDALRVSPDDADDLRIEFVPGGAHYLLDDNPAEVARLVREFAGLPVTG